MKKKLFILLIGSLFQTAVVNAQDTYFKCGTTEMVNRALQKNPQLLSAYEIEQERLKTLDQEAAANNYETRNKAAAVIYRIPIVFHILHQYGSENISDAQVIDAVRILNEDYRKLNADFANTISAFTGIAADAEIEFTLAKKTPTGACTNGIDRIYTSLTNAADDNSKLNYWPRANYLNVWVVKTIGTAGVAGYAYTPGSAFNPAVDGILILSNYIGSIGSGSQLRSHALTHEIGHFLNLLHTWGNGNTPGLATNCNGDDNVTDTPNTIGWTTCNLAGISCSTLDNVQNFMEYSYCSTMYTTGQKTRMRNALGSATAQRNSLVTASTGTLTGITSAAVLCKADFTSNSTTNVLCAGDSITFTDISWNGTPTAWNWTFPGGTPANSALANPTVHYNTAGTYSVSLSVSNTSGTVSTTKGNYVFVNPTSAVYVAALYSEGFENSAIPNTDWRINNVLPAGNTWLRTNTAAATGTYSVMINNLSTMDTQVDELIGPSFDITTISSGTPTLEFKVAYAQRVSTNTDKLQVYVSTNCGKSWTLRKTIQGTSLSTGGVQTTSFVPNSTQWATQTVSLGGYATQTNLFVMFRFTSNGGNNIYLDDINITGITAINEPYTPIALLNTFPNPNNGNFTTNLTLSQKQNVELKISNVLGQTVYEIYKGMLMPGSHTFELPQNTKLLPGLYFVNLWSEQKTMSRKIIVQE
jgi:PKD repeat protein